ncbi:MAG TPA: ABC transporter substrate-binding protein [Candidatus Limnocylindria bacterium]|nr:ABC transporter substrate-binding protein [Candidatus Limnocylindria bacterium]
MRRTFFALLILVLAACGGTPAASLAPSSSASATASAAASFPLTVSDFQDRSVTVPKRPERVVSIGPSNTEFLFALGAGDRVVGVDDFSDEPDAAKAKNKVGGVKPNVEQIVSLRPDLVVSVKISDGSLERLAAQGLVVLVVNPQSAADVARTAVLLGRAIGADGDALAKSIQTGLDAVRAKAASLRKKRVYHEIDASDPNKLYTVGPGSFVHDLIGLAGGINIAANAGSQYPQLSPEEIVRADPEVIVFASFGVTPEQIAARPGWSVITAVKTKRVLRVEGSLMSRPGPRLAQAAEAYYQILAASP